MLITFMFSLLWIYSKIFSSYFSILFYLIHYRHFNFQFHLSFLFRIEGVCYTFHGGYCFICLIFHKKYLWNILIVLIFGEEFPLFPIHFLNSLFQYRSLWGSTPRSAQGLFSALQSGITIAGDKVTKHYMPGIDSSARKVSSLLYQHFESLNGSILKITLNSFPVRLPVVILLKVIEKEFFSHSLYF